MFVNGCQKISKVLPLTSMSSCYLQWGWNSSFTLSSSLSFSWGIGCVGGKAKKICRVSHNMSRNPRTTHWQQSSKSRREISMLPKVMFYLFWWDPQAPFPGWGLYTVQVVSGGRVIPDSILVLPCTPCLHVIVPPLSTVLPHSRCTWLLALPSSKQTDFTNAGQTCMFQTFTGHIKANIHCNITVYVFSKPVPCILGCVWFSWGNYWGGNYKIRSSFYFWKALPTALYKWDNFGF